VLLVGNELSDLADAGQGFSGSVSRVTGCEHRGLGVGGTPRPGARCVGFGFGWAQFGWGDGGRWQ